jgi:UbiD family decarboxylase
MNDSLLSRDFRGYLAALEESGQVVRIQKSVESRFELAAVTRHIQKTTNLPVIFQNVSGTDFAVASNAYGNYGILARLLGTEVSGVAKRWSEMTSAPDGQDLAPAPDDGPPAVNPIALSDVPHLIFCEKDAGPYITAGVVLARDPESGVVNLSYHRMQIISETELRMRLSRSGDLYRFQQKAESGKQALEVAVLIGCSPAVALAGAAPLAAGTSELALAERFAGRRMALRPCEEVKLNVPVDVEFVIEGAILPDVRRPEGPFGEWMDFYVPVTDNHVLEVRRVTARENAVFHAVLSGSPEELTLSAIPNAALIYQAVRAFDPYVVDVACHPFVQFVVIKMKKQYEGQPQKAMLGAMGAETNRMLDCVVVDEDVDIHDLSDVVWAMTSRCRPDRDIFQVPNVPSFARDPHEVHWGRLCVDATAPLEWAEEFARKRYPGLESVRLEDYLDRP